jgi:hypothetical protein
MAPTPTPKPSPSAGPKTSSSSQLVDKASDEAKSTTPPPTGTTIPKGVKYGLDGRPIQSPIYAGQAWFAPLKPGETASTFKKTQYYKGAGMTYLQTLTNKQRIAVLEKLAQIPGAYSNVKDIPTSDYLRGLSASQLISVRPEDAAAVEKLMYISDSVGENIEDTITRFFNDPKLAQQILNATGLVGKKVSLTPADALRVEFTQAISDFLDDKADKKLADSYVDTINKLELKRGGNITQLERQTLLFDFVQKQAMEKFKDDKQPDSLLVQRGAVGGAYNTLRKRYDAYGVPVDDKTLYKQAIDGVRSRTALENAIQKVAVQAQVAFPALAQYFQQGLTTKEALATYIGIKSKIFEVPENSIQISEMYPVFKGKELMSPEEWQKYLYSLPEYKKTKTYQRQTFGDAATLMRNFNLL